MASTGVKSTQRGNHRGFARIRTGALDHQPLIGRKIVPCPRCLNLHEWSTGKPMKRTPTCPDFSTRRVRLAYRYEGLMPGRLGKISPQNVGKYRSNDAGMYHPELMPCSASIILGRLKRHAHEIHPVIRPRWSMHRGRSPKCSSCGQKGHPA